MGGDGADAAGDEGAGDLYGVYGVGYDAGFEVGGGADGWGGGFVAGAGRESV